MPFTVIITAANTVSRARLAFSGPPDAISVRMSATSMTVTATASTSDPNGSPTRWATTSAWCTAASTAPASTTATRSTGTSDRSRPHVSASATSATTGTAVVQGGSTGVRVAVSTRVSLPDGSDSGGGAPVGAPVVGVPGPAGRPRAGVRARAFWTPCPDRTAAGLPRHGSRPAARGTRDLWTSRADRQPTRRLALTICGR